MRIKVTAARRRLVFGMVGIAVGILCLWLTSRFVDWRAARSIVYGASPYYVAFGIGLFALDLFLRVFRWRMILAIQADVSLGSTSRALIVGYAMNNILPARLGEFYRVFDLAKADGIPASVVLASVILERLLDLAAVAALLACGLALAVGDHSISVRLLVIAVSIAGVSAATLACLVWIISRRSIIDFLQGKLSHWPGGYSALSRICYTCSQFAGALKGIKSRQFAVAALLTLPIWIVESASIWTVCRAVGMNLDLPASLVLVGAGSLSTMVPTAPAYVGSLQVAFAVVLAQFDIDATLAVAGATAVQIYLIACFSLLGLMVMLGRIILRYR